MELFYAFLHNYKTNLCKKINKACQVPNLNYKAYTKLYKIQTKSSDQSQSFYFEHSFFGTFFRSSMKTSMKPLNVLLTIVHQVMMIHISSVKLRRKKKAAICGIKKKTEIRQKVSNLSCFKHMDALLIKKKHV